MDETVGGIEGSELNYCPTSRKQKHVPHILIGASSSSKMGWLMNISRAFVHRYLISYSCSCTGFPGRFPRTDEQEVISDIFSHQMTRQ